jgi:hypothetical protein
MKTQPLWPVKFWISERLNKFKRISEQTKVLQESDDQGRSTAKGCVFKEGNEGSHIQIE